MKTRMLSATALIGTFAVTASGVQPAFAANPTRQDHDPNVSDAGMTTVNRGLGIYDSGGAGGEDLKASKHDYGLADMACASDDRSTHPLGSHGHLAADIDTDDDRQSLCATPPAYIIAGLSATSAAGAFAPS